MEIGNVLLGGVMNIKQSLYMTETKMIAELPLDQMKESNTSTMRLSRIGYEKHCIF